jgi:hypothetical protein
MQKCAGEFWGAQAASLQVSAACRDQGVRALSQNYVYKRCCRQGCGQLQAGSLCSPQLYAAFADSISSEYLPKRALLLHMAR